MVDRWHESDDPEKFTAGAGWLTWKVALFGTIAVLILSGLVWLVMFGTSDLRGRGDAQQQRNSGENRVRAQKAFHDNYQSVLTADRNIQIAYDEKQADPDDQVKATNYSGLVRNCNDAIGRYNSLARQFLAEEFRDADLPTSLPDKDPETPATEADTDCKENTK
jgi:hypothetical protein